MRPPPAATITRAAACEARKTPVRFTRSTLSHASSRMLERRRAPARAGVVDEDVEAAELGEGAPDDLLGLPGVADVPAEADGPDTEPSGEVRGDVGLRGDVGDARETEEVVRRTLAEADVPASTLVSGPSASAGTLRPDTEPPGEVLGRLLASLSPAAAEHEVGAELGERLRGAAAEPARRRL